ncbi:TPA: hypothetical protein ACF2C8_000172 [Clostridium perfringens]
MEVNLTKKESIKENSILYEFTPDKEDMLSKLRSENNDYRVEFFKKAILDTTNFSLKYENEYEIVFELNESYSKQYKRNCDILFNKEMLSEIILKAINLETYMNGYILENKAEFLVKKTNPFLIRDQKRINFVSDNNIEIYIDSASNELNMLMFLYGYHGYKNKKLRIRRLLFNRNIELAEEQCDKAFQDGFKILRDRSLLSVNINSKDKISKQKFLDYKNAYLFNLSFCLNQTFILYKVEYSSMFLEVLREKRRIMSEKTSEIDVPRKKYNKDILEYYINAKIIDNLPAQYLSYYHILEYFFEDVHYEDMIKEVKDKISSPSFSIKNDNSVKSFIKGIEDKISRQKSEGFVFNEKNALRLTIDKYIILNDIEQKLGDEKSRYFKNTECEFSNAKKITFSNVDTIVNRIYKVRNSLVHSKNTDLNRFIPFKHENILKKEIELIKVIAEMLIINSAKLI